MPAVSGAARRGEHQLARPALPCVRYPSWGHQCASIREPSETEGLQRGCRVSAFGLQRAVAVLIAVLVLSTVGAAGTWAPYLWWVPDAPDATDTGVDECAGYSGPTRTKAIVEDVNTCLAPSPPHPSEMQDATISVTSDAIMGIKVKNPCTVCYSYAWKAIASVEGDSGLEGSSVSYLFDAASWGSAQGCFQVWGDVILVGRAAIAVDSDASNTSISIQWPAKFGISSESITRSNNTDNAPLSGTSTSSGSSLEAQVLFSGFSKAKGHTGLGNWAVFLSEARISASSDVKVNVTLKGFRAQAGTPIDPDFDAPVCLVEFRAPSLVPLYLYDWRHHIEDEGGDCPVENPEPDGELELLDPEDPPCAPEGRDPDWSTRPSFPD
jgi:hypothetical protein